VTTEVEDDEVILFEQRPNAFLYALEVTRIGYPLVAVALLASLSVIYFKGMHVSMVRAALLELFLYALGNLCFLRWQCLRLASSRLLPPISG
jgi:hypothetical protein